MKQRYDELNRQAWSMPDGKGKLALLEEAIRIADVYLTKDDAYEARMTYSSAALESGCPERLLVSFAWCLARFEQHPEEHSSFTILWHYKWVLHQVWRLPQLSLKQIDGLFDDFKAKCLQYGFSLRPYYQQMLSYKQAQGKMEEAVHYYKLWKKTPRDGLSDCRACEQNQFGEYYFKRNQFKRGMGAMKPILEGKLQCRSVPQNTYSQIIMPLLQLGEYEEAVRIARKAFRKIEGPSYLYEYGIFLAFFAVTDMEKAVKLYERTIHLGLASRMPWDRFHYLLAVKLFLGEWNRAKRRRKLAESERVTPEWLDREVRSIAAAFDERNGNAYVTEWIGQQQRAMTKLAAAYRKEA